MRFLSIAALSLLGSGLSLATAQQLKTAGTTVPKKHTGVTAPQNSIRKVPNQNQTTEALKTSRKMLGAGAQDFSQLLGRFAPPRGEKGMSGPPGNHVSGGSDSCATATPIAGNGPFAGDNNGATTDGPSNCGALAEDVWYDWTSADTGSVTVSLCGSAYDTVITVYDGSSCVGTMLACNDDSACGLQSTAAFPATAGNVYKIQIGGFGGANGSYTMSFTPPPPPCACAGNPPEGEPDCGIPVDTFNGGCNSAPVVVSPINVGDCVCGVGAFDGSTRDTDWYEFTLAAPDTVTWTVTAEYPHAAAILDNLCPPTVITFVTAGACQTIATSSALAAGTYRLFAAADFVSNVACPGPGSSYTACLTSGGGGGCGNDDCNTPQAIAGAGPFAFDNCCATTGVEGQTEPLCLFFSTTAITNDLWYTWGPAPASGSTTVSLCPTGSGDSRLAVYDGSGCPAGPALACNDDSCSLLSEVSFNAVAGNFYTFQVGNYPGASCMANGSFTVTAPAGNQCEVYDDGVTENSLGFGAATGTDILWLHRQGAVAGSTTVSAIETAWGTPLFGGTSAPPAGTSVRVGIWDDPNDDGNPNDLVLLQEINTVSANPNTDMFQSVPIAPQVTSGVYFIGASSSGSFPAPMDENSASLGRAWVCGDNAGTIDYNNLNGEPLVPQEMDGLGFPAVFLLRAVCGGPVCAGDECASPIAINGAGPHPFDNCCATTGVEGQNEGLCLFFSTTGFDNDIWYTWGPAASSGTTQVSLCGQTTADTRLAVFDGTGCPVDGTAIACNDDSCGLQSSLTFNATAGNFYTFHLGNYPGALCGSGTFEVTTLAPPGDCDVYDDGVTENSLGFGAATGTDILWMHVQGAPGGSSVVKSISTAWGTPLFGGTSAPPAGSPVRVGIWDDPNDDGNPNDLVLLQEVNTTSTNPNTDIKQVVPLSPSVQTSGVYFIGASSEGSFPAPMDENNASLGRAWVCGDNAGTISYNNLNGEPLPPAEMGSIGFPAVFLLEGDCKDIAITAMCFGDGTSSPCPCLGVGGSTNGAPGNGCGNSANPAGANLSAQGNPIDSDDTLLLTATGMRPGTLCLFIQGDQEVNKVTYGDGLRCFAGNMLRLYKITPHPGAGSAPTGNTIPPNISISDRSAQLGFPIVNGDYIYQVWYRDPTRPFACDEFQPVGATFNVTNGLRVTWSL